MAVEVDYYQLLDIARGATDAQVTDAVKKQMRQWRKKTEASDLTVRQEAEVMVKRIEEARTTLTNAAKRAEYNARLDREGVQRTTPEASAPGGGSWLDRAKHYLAVGDYHSAAYAAREATQTSGNSAESWSIRSRANEGIGRLEDAIYEAQQAVDIERGNPDYHFLLGSVAEKMSRYDQAMSEYQTASQIEPAAPMYQLAIGGVLLQTGSPERALKIIEQVHAKHPQDQTAVYYLGQALIDVSENVPARKHAGGYWVTSPAEISRMREYVERGKALSNLPGDLRAEFQKIDAYLKDMERRRFNVPTAMMASAGLGCGGVLFAIALVILPLFLIIGGFAAMGGGSPGGGIVLVLIGGALAWLWYSVMWVPGWKVNKRAHA